MSEWMQKARLQAHLYASGSAGRLKVQAALIDSLAARLISKGSVIQLDPPLFLPDISAQLIDFQWQTRPTLGGLLYFALTHWQLMESRQGYTNLLWKESLPSLDDTTQDQLLSLTNKILACQFAEALRACFAHTGTKPDFVLTRTPLTAEILKTVSLELVPPVLIAVLPNDEAAWRQFTDESGTVLETGYSLKAAPGYFDIEAAIALIGVSRFWQGTLDAACRSTAIISPSGDLPGSLVNCYFQAIGFHYPASFLQIWIPSSRKPLEKHLDSILVSLLPILGTAPINHLFSTLEASDLEMQLLLSEYEQTIRAECLNQEKVWLADLNL